MCHAPMYMDPDWMESSANAEELQSEFETERSIIVVLLIFGAVSRFP